MSTHTGYLASEFRLDQFIGYAVWGGLYNLSRYTTEASESGEGWTLSKARKTLTLGIIAGFIVAATDGDMTPEGFEYAMIMAVPVANELSNAWRNLRRQIANGEFPDWAEDWFEHGTSPVPEPSPPPTENDPGTEPETEAERRADSDHSDGAATAAKVVTARLTRSDGDNSPSHDE